MKHFFYILLLCICSAAYSQAITVDNTSNTPSDLVNLLIGNACVEVTNVTISSAQSVAYFNRNGSGFPINEGIIIRTGNALDSQGNYSGNNMGSAATGGGSDAFLQNLSNTSSGTTSPLTDLAFLEFEFTSISDSFSFDFIFASNEYGQFQCLSNDIFAFELTDLTVSGPTSNIAVIPNSNNPVSVKYIKDAQYNNSCSSTNPGLFSVYNVTNPGASTLNMRGHTVVLNASAAIVPNHQYRLKLVIADYVSSNFDSAVFIAGGSFDASIDLGADRIICSGDSYTLETNLDNTYTFDWLRNGIATGSTGASFTVTQPGTYTVNITKGGCFLTDTIVFNDLIVNTPLTLQQCDNGSTSYSYALTLNNETQLGIDDTVYDIYYYASLADITANTPIPAANLANYTSPGGETIYLKIFNTQTNLFCDALYSFGLVLTPPVVAGSNITISTCDNPSGQNYNLLNVNAAVLDGLPSSDFTISYYNTQSDANSASNSIGTNLFIPAGTTSVTVWALMQSISNPSCYDVTSAVIIVNPRPLVDTITQIVECHDYLLQPLTNGNYFTGPNGTGTPLNAGDTIDQGGTYYIFNGPDANGCTNQSTFTAYFVDEYVPPLDNCGSFTVPVPHYNIGAFYTAPGGPTGSGSLVPAGTVYTNPSATVSMSVNLYYFAEVNGVPCVDVPFTINIHPLPLADDPTDVITCNSYTLPALTNGTYYALSGGPSTIGQSIVNNPITTTQTVYVYNQNTFTDVNGMLGVCAVENPFTVNIIDTSAFAPVNACGSYTLPPVIIGGYFDAPNGGGNPIDPSQEINSSQTVYYHANTTTVPNCTETLNLAYNITIHQPPAVDTIDSGTYCGEFILPVLNNGTYYTGPGGTGSVLAPGTIIDLSGNSQAPGTYYIYNTVIYPDSTRCSNESSFTITITPFPGLNQYINTIECGPYSIPTPAAGAIYTEADGPNGTGTIVSSSTIFNSTQTFFLYYVDPVSGCKIDKEFSRIYKGIDLPAIDDIKACDTYTFSPAMLALLNHLPPETAEPDYTINFHFNDPSGPIVPAGYIFNTANTPSPQTICLHAVNTDNHLTNCSETKYFTVTISETPDLTSLGLTFLTEKCGNYQLPALPSVPYTINYYTQPGGNTSDLLANTNVTTAGTYTYYVYAFASDNPDCHDELSFTFTVHPLLELNPVGGTICVDPITNQATRTYTVHTGLDPALFDVNWSLNGILMGSGVSYTASQAGTYTVDFIKLTPEIGADCNYKSTTVIIEQSSTAVASYTLSGAFEETIDITVNIDVGFGNYLYQLEDGPLQTSNVFSGVAAGEYTIYIYDTLAQCGRTELNVNVLGYPNFFTPNGDGSNDFWNITTLKDQPEAVIYIFDRFGKLLKQISPAGRGWDGTYNGQPMPSTDYWFLVAYQLNGEPREFKAHFSMKR